MKRSQESWRASQERQAEIQRGQRASFGIVR